MSISLSDALSIIDYIAQFFILLGAFLLGVDCLHFLRNLSADWWKNRTLNLTQHIITFWQTGRISLAYLGIALIIHALLADYAADFDYPQMIIGVIRGTTITMLGYTLLQLIKIAWHNHRRGDKLLLLNHENKKLLINAVIWLIMVGIAWLVFS